MPILFTMPGSCALSPNIAVAWLNAPIEIRNIAYGDQKKDDYLAINPKGKVPALRFDDGCAYGPEGSQADQATLENKVEAASYFTAELAEAGIGGTHIEDGHVVLNDNLVGPSHSSVSSVTSDDATVQASEAATDAFVAGGGGAVGAT
ncbi:MAG: glutathione S-transferase, partial [Nitrobacter vulgaris]|nr:glutathione S-transferase [Nitrobacter vulgaris]